MQKDNQPYKYQRFIWSEDLTKLQTWLVLAKLQLGIYNKKYWDEEQKMELCRNFISSSYPAAYYNQDSNVLTTLYVLMRANVSGNHRDLFFNALLNAWDFIRTVELGYFEKKTIHAQELYIAEHVDAFLSIFRKQYGKLNYETYHTLTQSIGILLRIRLTNITKGQLLYLFMLCPVQTSDIYED